MRHFLILAILLLAAAPALRAAPPQSPPSSQAVPQASESEIRPQANAATSHDRHLRKHRSGSRHHRPRTTSRGHRSR